MARRRLVHGFASNEVVSQSPAPGTRLLDTGAPTIVLRLAKAKSVTESGTPQDVSTTAGTAVKLAELAVGPVTKPVLRSTSAATLPNLASKSTKAATKPAAKAPAKRAPAKRPPRSSFPTRAVSR